MSTDADADALRAFRPERPTYELTRVAILRALGAIHVVAFLSLADQIVPLIGEHGILPARLLLLDDALDGTGLLDRPTVFAWIGASDHALLALAWLGAVLGALVMLGVTNAVVLVLLWALQLSFVSIGQVFLGYGWEILLAEATFLAIFLCPLRSIRPLPTAPAPPIVIGLFRWLALRLMLGAGLIKLRGDPCWRDLTCLDWHYETQPLPSPLSWLWDRLPPAILHGGVAINHVVELVVPFGLLGPRPVRAICGAITIAFQLSLIASGNLSYLNWLTIAIAIACFDDGQIARVLPLRPRPAAPISRAAFRTSIALAIVVGVLSVGPVVNMLSPDQAMNASFDPLRLVNTYGAFGSVNDTRRELVIEGTRDEDPAHARWAAYVAPCQPGPVSRRPCFVAPWPLRLDWQMWFAAMSVPERQPWLVHLVWQLLSDDRDARTLFSWAPFAPGAPPRWIRIVRWRYRFAEGGEAWWARDEREIWLRPVSRDDPALRDYVEAHGWEDEGR